MLFDQGCSRFIQGIQEGRFGCARAVLMKGNGYAEGFDEFGGWERF